jgi:hypothetical protein
MKEIRVDTHNDIEEYATAPKTSRSRNLTTGELDKPAVSSRYLRDL